MIPYPYGAPNKLLALTLAQWGRVPIMVSRYEPLCTRTLSPMSKIADRGFPNPSEYGIRFRHAKLWLNIFHLIWDISESLELTQRSLLIEIFSSYGTLVVFIPRCFNLKEQDNRYGLMPFKRHSMLDSTLEWYISEMIVISLLKRYLRLSITTLQSSEDALYAYLVKILVWQTRTISCIQLRITSYDRLPKYPRIIRTSYWS